MEDVVKCCLKRGFLLEAELANLLKEIYKIDKDLSIYLLDILHNIKKDKFLTKNLFSEHLSKILIILENYTLKNKDRETALTTCLEIIKKRFSATGCVHTPEEDVMKLSIAKEAEKKNSIGPLLRDKKEGAVQVIESYNLPTRKILVGDFVKHFRNRFLVFKNFLQERANLRNLISINKISGQKQNVSIIGIVFNKRWTKNKNLLLEVEDLTGRINLLVNASKEDILKKAKGILLDEVVGFRCTGTHEILFVNDIVFPETKNLNIKNSPNEVYAAFISDVHTGSKRFLEKNFRKFVKWLNAEIGSEKQKEIASKVKYLFVVGDTVDGVGVTPGQEELLEIFDIKQQYEKLAELLGGLRKNINIILSPGQHDCVRVAEPQPPLDKNIASSLYNLPNIFLVSNPAWVNIAASKNFPGFNVLMYHGASFHSFINDIEELRFSNAHHNPTKIIRYVLQKRHLAPTHSSVLYIPSPKEDPLIIHKIPDIITTGEMHRSEIARYNNILCIQCSCWQTTTLFEEKIGNEPDPCKVPILNLKTSQVSMLDFS